MRLNPNATGRIVVCINCFKKISDGDEPKRQTGLSDCDAYFTAFATSDSERVADLMSVS